MYINGHGHVTCDSFESLYPDSNTLEPHWVSPKNNLVLSKDLNLTGTPIGSFKFNDSGATPIRKSCWWRDEPRFGGKAMLNAPYHTEMIFHIQEEKKPKEAPIAITKVLILKNGSEISPLKASYGTVRGTGCTSIVY